MTPIVIAGASLAFILRDMADRIEAGDSFEGNIEYTCISGNDLGPDEFEVMGVYRYGNSEGQGSVRLIGNV